MEVVMVLDYIALVILIAVIALVVYGLIGVWLAVRFQ